MMAARRKEIEALRDEYGDSTDQRWVPAYSALDDLLAELQAVTDERDGVLAKRVYHAKESGCPLNGKQLTALLYAANGNTVPEHAATARASADTIRSRRRYVIDRLKARNIAHAVAICLARGWLDLSDIEIPERCS